LLVPHGYIAVSKKIQQLAIAPQIPPVILTCSTGLDYKRLLLIT
jgi:hypothetical protein